MRYVLSFVWLIFALGPRYSTAQSLPAINTPLKNCVNGAALYYDATNILSCTPPTSTVGALPTCNASNKGLQIVVTDALLPSLGASLTGGGAVTLTALCNGSVWVGN